MSNNPSNPDLDPGILLSHGHHELVFAAHPVPARVYMWLEGWGGDHCGESNDDDASVEFGEGSYTVYVDVAGDSARLFLIEWNPPELYIPPSTGTVYR